MLLEMVPPKSSAKTAAKTAAKTNPSPAEKKTSVDAPDAGDGLGKYLWRQGCG